MPANLSVKGKGLITVCEQAGRTHRGVRGFSVFSAVPVAFTSAGQTAPIYLISIISSIRNES